MDDKITWIILFFFNKIFKSKYYLEILIQGGWKDFIQFLRDWR